MALMFVLPAIFRGSNSLSLISGVQAVGSGLFSGVKSIGQGIGGALSGKAQQRRSPHGDKRR